MAFRSTARGNFFLATKIITFAGEIEEVRPAPIRGNQRSRIGCTKIFLPSLSRRSFSIRLLSRCDLGKPCFNLE